MEKIARVSQEIPLDLLLDILTKLPVKSLCRFQCVCKLWRSVVADPRFVEVHRACSAARPELLIRFQGHEKVDGLKLIHNAYTCKLDSMLHSRDNRGLTRTYRNLVPVQNPALDRGCISHQVDGLYCLPFFDSVRVWNPVTRESLDIRTVESENDFGFISVDHFGFDPVEKKHKVLHILTKYSTRTAVKSRVFILEENCWRATANPHPPNLTVFETMSVICVDGIIFSSAYTTDLSEQKLTAFHVRLETFELITAPESSKRKILIEFAGRAALVNPKFNDPSEGLILWVLEDLRQRAWRLKTRVLPNCDLGRMTLEGGTPTGELVFMGGFLTESLFVLLYNVESNVARRIEVQGLHERILKQVRYVAPCFIKVHFHVESLRSPKGASSFNIDSTCQTLDKSKCRIRIPV